MRALFNDIVPFLFESFTAVSLRVVKESVFFLSFC